MTKRHTLLARQLRRHFGEDFSVPAEWQRFIDDVNDAYAAFDSDRAMIERSMDLSSQELIGINEDLRRKEEMLIAERDMAQMIFDIAGVIILAMDLDGRITKINKKGCEILGYSSDEIVGEKWFDKFIPERLRGEVFHIFQALIAEGFDARDYFENAVLTKGGVERYVAWHNNAIRDKSGAIVGILSSGEDITSSKRAQDELQRRMMEIEKLNKFMIGREMRIIEMKREVNELLGLAGKEAKYRI